MKSKPTILSLKSQVLCLFLCVLSLVSVCPVFAEPRTAKVAGGFYPADPEALRSLITQLLSQQPAPESHGTPRLLIVPHAGYAYSGIVAARGFREVQGRSYDAVVVVGFTHHTTFDGTSVDDRDTYLTPLGAISVETDAVTWLASQPTIRHVEEAHESREHSLEVMLPFLQVALGEFRLVPVLMGSADHEHAEALAEALAALAKRGDYLFVFSTDLSHYHPYEQAVQRDAATLNAIVGETAQGANRLFRMGGLEACGRGPILAALSLAKRLGYPTRHLLAYANSGDTTGDTERVVGYAAIGMYEHRGAPSDALISHEAGMALVKAARLAIQGIFHPAPSLTMTVEASQELTHPRGLFVTLRRRTGELRGCIGRIESDVPLAKLVQTVAVDAALHDARFQPLSAEELDDVTVEVSVLSPPRPIAHPQEIVAGRDGVVLRKNGRSGVFLPQVWEETGWTRVEFLRELTHQKAGLDPDAWKQAQLFVFQDQTFEE